MAGDGGPLLSARLLEMVSSGYAAPRCASFLEWGHIDQSYIVGAACPLRQFCGPWSRHAVDNVVHVADSFPNEWVLICSNSQPSR
jgi:hypothetical protein